MKFTRILSLFLALLMVATVFVACDDEEEVPADTPTGETTLNLITTGVTEYVLVRDYQASQAVISAVQNLAESIKLNIGADVVIKECFVGLEEENDVETAKEILIGTTNRQESIDALKGLRSKDYTISVHNEKLVIAGGGDDGTLNAITRFLNDFVAEQGNRFAVKQGELQSLVFATSNAVNYTGSYSYTSATILGARIDSYALIYSKEAANSDDCRLLAEALSSHISTQTGYELSVAKSNLKVGDFEILIGDPKGNDYRAASDTCICDELGDDEYYIKLVKTTDNYIGDDKESAGAQLYICFGKNAKDTVLKVFTSEIMPTLQTPGAFTMEEGFVKTNRAS
ncbi:MAG: hypothetical protein IJX39_06820 [Clostridia bacterium]|nr:hypothetical protein [Clostridia bacterium]